ncbi:hypothetical protein [Roseateles violae]|uniref:Uncharacterized protein n=1 Tax=Roseateles violae TaxID=3058042 RepID=A0ABT8DNU2_9BURK|nr:hypothetical protein [Pelomonas sp. PFR6]MDN3919671.1 hypothetical protein [Pelomonas sp. PFR6]
MVGDELDKLIAAAPEAQVRAVLGQLLKQYLNPVFGALPKAELELAMLEALQRVGAVEADPGIYELISKLRVTKPKARNLIYARELRRHSAPELDERMKQLLRHPLLQKNGELFALEVENPLLSDHLRARLQVLGHASDGSFSSSLVLLRAEALAALVASCLTADEQEKLRRALVKAGAPDSSLRGLLAGGLKTLGGKLASKAGEAAAEQLADYLGPVLDGAIKPAVDKLSGLFRPAGAS